MNKGFTICCNNCGADEVIIEVNYDLQFMRVTCECGNSEELAEQYEQ